MFLGGAVDHYNRTIGQRCGSADNNFSSIFASNCQFWNGYDLMENGTPYMDIETYSSDLFGQKAADIINTHDVSRSMLLQLHFTAPHTPLQAPQEYLDLCTNVSPGPKEAYQTYYRSIICGMIVSVDINVLRVILALYARNMLASTLILFHSDNGGYLQAGSLNVPFRGQKGTPFEGGVRVPAFLYGTSLGETTNGVHFQDLIHVSDILPTLMGYLNADSDTISTYKFDGINHWPNLSKRTPLQRNEIHIDTSSRYMAYSSGYLRTIQNITYKYVFNPSVITFLFMRQKITEEYEYEGEYLFNLSDDPSEQVNLIPLMTLQANLPSRSHNSHRLNSILELMRQEVFKARELSYPTLLTGMPPHYDYPPSPLGCWLPMDSPHYETFDCGIKTNFNLPKLPPSAKFLYTFDSLPNMTSEIMF